MPLQQKIGRSVRWIAHDQGKEIAALEDAGCRDDKVSFSRLLLDAPQVHSRYKGKIMGLVIAEIALFRPGNDNFEFDPVFKRVPILPRLKYGLSSSAITKTWLG
jgi:hypothetical protein